MAAARHGHIARKAGSAKGRHLYIAEDFDAPLEDFTEYMLSLLLFPRTLMLASPICTPSPLLAAYPVLSPRGKPRVRRRAIRKKLASESSICPTIA